MKNDSITIDIRYVVFSIFRKWKYIVFAVVLGLLLAALWGVFAPNSGILSIRDLQKAVSEAQEAYEAGDESVYDAVIHSIAEKQAENLDLKNADIHKIEIYSHMMNDYYAEKLMAEQSYLMQINETAYYQGILKIYFRCNEMDARDYCLAVFDAQTMRQALKERMAESVGMGDEMDKFTYSFPYSLWHDYLNNAVSTISVSGGLNNLLKDLKITEGVEDGIIFSCTTNASTKEDAQAMLQVGIEEIERIFAGLKAEGYNFYYEALLQEVNPAINGTVKKTKDEINAELQEKYDAILRYREKLNQVELDYYENYFMLVNGNNDWIQQQYSVYDSFAPKANYRANQLNGIVEARQKGMLVSMLKVCIIFSMLGAILGVLACVIHACVTSAKTFVLPQDVEDCCETKVLGCMSICAGKRKRQYRYFEMFRNSKEYVSKTLSLMGKRFVFIGNVQDRCIRETVEDMATLCENAQYGADIAGSVDTLEKAKHSEGVVFVVVSEKTRRQELLREWRACNIQSIPILGVIMLHMC